MNDCSTFGALDGVRVECKNDVTWILAYFTNEASRTTKLNKQKRILWVLTYCPWNEFHVILIDPIYKEVGLTQPRTQALPLRSLGKDPGERWWRVSQNLGDRNCHKGGEVIFQSFLSDEGPMLETLDHTICIGSTPTFLYFDLYLYSAYAAHYVY